MLQTQLEAVIAEFWACHNFVLSESIIEMDKEEVWEHAKMSLNTKS